MQAVACLGCGVKRGSGQAQSMRLWGDCGEIKLAEGRADFWGGMEDHRGAIICVRVVGLWTETPSGE